jgi:outer membrane protein OmpA-like peptidoglycan-associated protein
MAGEQMSVTVRLLDLDGNLTQELKIPVNSSTSSIEVPVNNVVGAFNLIAATSNGSVSSTPMSLLPEIIKAETMGVSKPSRAKRLMGTLVSRDFIFTPNSAVLSPAVKKGLRKAAIVAKARNKRVAVTGFAAVSGLGSNFERRVAERRARAVSEFLRKRGVESWIYYKGLSGPEGLSFPGQPRRVEIRILK